MACQPHSERHQRPIGNAHTRKVQDFVVYAGNRFIASAGMPTYAGPNKNATWHCACVVAWQFWTAPSDYARLLRRLQARRCGETGGRLWKTAEVDHRIPLFRVWGDHRDAPWPELLGYWGLPNLQVINQDVHTAKCANEARDRRAARYQASELV